MYRATSFWACSRVGWTVRLTRSTFTAALNDSACALSKHTPVRPTERRIPSSAVLLANACEVYWVPVGVEYRPGGEGVITARHLQRVDDQVGSHVLGHRVADAGLGVAVDNGGQKQPALPGGDVGDVPDQLHPRPIGGEVTAQQVWGRRGVAGDGGGRPPRPRLAGPQVQLPHQRSDELQAGGHAEAGQLGLYPPVAVGVVRVGEHLPDQQPQLGPAGRRRRARPAAPFIEPGCGHGHPLAHLHDRVQCLLRVDELVLTAHRYSWAKKAAAFPKNSVFIRNSRTSRSSSRSRARSETLNAGSSSTCSVRYLFTQFPRVPSLTCMSRAISVIGRD